VSDVHQTAAKGFTKPDVYELGRPGYPEGVLDAMGIERNTVVVDLGCGTGKLTRQLITASDHVIGVDPLAPMLGTFHSSLPDVPAVAGQAEAFPLRDGVADVVVCASAFHWFDHARAVPEIHRVLRTRGSLAIVWNRRDELAGWAGEFWKITEAYRGDTPGYRTSGWREALESSPLFGDIEETWFDHVQITDAEGLVARVASVSFIETLPDDERQKVLNTARTFATTHPALAGRDVIELPYRSVVYITHAM
jgi:SAM-dependent methyltransferase